MDKKTNQRQQQPADDKNELVRQYREIGISAVAAAARCQRADPAASRSRARQVRSSIENADGPANSIRPK
jgi:transposase-like protein